MLRMVMIAGSGSAPPVSAVTISEVAVTRFDSAAPSKTVPLPESAAGDILCIVLAVKAIEEAKFSTPAGWTYAGKQVDSGGSGTALRVFWIVSSGGAASSVTLKSSSSTAACATVFRVSGATGLSRVGRNWSNVSTRPVISATSPPGACAAVSALFAAYNLSPTQWGLPENQLNLIDVSQIPQSQFIFATGESALGLPALQPWVLSRNTYAAEMLLVFS